jgi:8-oxo-dGTP pyrophosphatase MutT (NUDIX family)
LKRKTTSVSGVPTQGAPDRGSLATRLSAGVVVVRQSPHGWLYLMLRAYRNWDFPKGLVEPGEEPLAAARREVAEETGIEHLCFRWGEAYAETPPYGHNKIARYYIAETGTEQVKLLATEELGRPEHHEWRWLSHAEALALASPRLRAILGWAPEVIARGERSG